MTQTNSSLTLSIPVQNFEEEHIEIKMDDGAHVNIIPKKIFDRLHVNNLCHSDIRLFGYRGENIKTIGVCELVCKHKDQTHHLAFNMCDQEATPILGLKSSIDMNVVKIIMPVEEDQNNSSEIEQLVNEYSDIFDGIGQFPGEYSFMLHPDAEPVVHPPRRVPMALCDKVKQ